MKRPRKPRPHLFVALGVLMLLAGFGLMLGAAFGGRLGSDEAFLLPVGFTTAAVGGMLLTRTPLAVFFLLVFSLCGLVLSLRETGPVHLLPATFALLIVCCIPLSRHTRL